MRQENQPISVKIAFEKNQNCHVLTHDSSFSFLFFHPLIVFDVLLRTLYNIVQYQCLLEVRHIDKIALSILFLKLFHKLYETPDKRRISNVIYVRHFFYQLSMTR